MPYRDLLANHLNHAADGAAILCWTTDDAHDLEILWTNAAFAALLDLPSAGADSAPLAERVGPVVAAEIAAAADESRRRGASVRRDLRLADRRSRAVWVELCVEPPNDRGFILVMLRDVTERRTREWELAETKARLADAVMERDATLRKLELALTMGDSAVWEWDRGTGFTLTGRMRGWVEAVGVTLTDFQDFAALYHPDDAERVAAAFQDHMERGAPFELSIRVRAPEGGWRWVRSSMRVIKAEGGAPVRALGFVKDIDEVHRLAERLQEAERAATAASEAKSLFLANMSHELRTPLNGVVGLAQTLARERLEPHQQELVALILSSGAHLERLVADIFDLARIEAGRLEVREEPFDAGAVLDSACADAALRAQAKGLTLHLAVDPQARARCIGDGTRLRQIVTNLLDNAVKFTEQGHVTLAARAWPEPDGRLLLQIAVEDTGPGVSPAAAKRLFQRFEQGDASTTRRQFGAGLGLAISRELARHMGGDVVLDPDHRPGARFVATVRPRRADADSASSEPPTTADALRGLSVLVAEDHPVNRRVFELLLTAFGAAPRFVEDGAQAVAAYEREAFDVILMDLQMPVLDGAAAIAAIRARERAQNLPRTPIIAVSARAMTGDVDQALAKGADGHVAKPIDAGLLAAAMIAAIAARRAQTPQAG